MGNISPPFPFPPSSPILLLTGTFRYTVSNCVGSIQGKVTLYVSSELSGLGQRPAGGGGLELPVVRSSLVTVDRFADYMQEKSVNYSRALRDEFLVRAIAVV